MLCLPNKAALRVACLVYEAMDVALKALKMGELQDAIDTEIGTHRKKYTDMVISDGIYSNFTSLRWGCISDDSISTGFLGNLYLFGEINLEKEQAINHEVDLMREGGSATSRTDAKEVLKLSLHLPLENKSLENFRRAEIVYSILLPMGHRSLTYLKEHIESMDDFRSQWKTIETWIRLSSLPRESTIHSTSPCN